VIVDEAQHPVRNQDGFAHPACGDEDQDAGIPVVPGPVQDLSFFLASHQFLEATGDAQIEQARRGNPSAQGSPNWRIGL